jgi:hypothetical protein
MSLDVYLDELQPVAVFDGNITHNLNKMADAAGIYKHLWRPDEIGVTKAHELIGPLREGLSRLTADPGFFGALEPENGYGSYSGLVEFVASYLEACEAHPHADVRVSR